MPIALTSDRLAKLDTTEAGRTVLNTLMIQTKLQGVNANSIKTVLEATQNSNQNGLDAFEKQAHQETEACQNDHKVLSANHAEAVARRYTLEKAHESNALYKQRENEYAQSLQSEVNGYQAFVADINNSQSAWEAFYNSMMNSIKTAQHNLAQIRTLIAKFNPHNAPSFAEVKSSESLVNEIKANLEYRFYDTLGMKPILTGLLETAAKGISTDQFYKISHTMDLVDNFLADRRNGLIEDNEYETTLNHALTNSINDSIASTNSNIEIVNGLVSSLDTRMGLLQTAVANAKQLSDYAKNVMHARSQICENFAKTYVNHVARYNNVRLTIAELSNAFEDEYKDFAAFLQRKLEME